MIDYNVQLSNKSGKYIDSAKYIQDMTCCTSVYL